MEKIKVAYLGPEGTFTEKVARKFFPDNVLVAIQPIRNVVRAVETKEAGFSIVPVENFYNGEVRETLDSLIECSRTLIIAETHLKVVHCLGALPGYRDIKKIISKDQALEQCSRYLCQHYPHAQTTNAESTSKAAELVKEQGMLDTVAIASEDALKRASLEIIARDICPNNKTRFVILGRHPTKQTGDDKTFIAIHPPIRDRPGVLRDIANLFAGLGINLEYIQSRPDGKKGYLFYIELEGHIENEAVKMALDAIRLSLDPKKAHQNVIKVLGSYENSHWKDEN